MNSTSSQNEPKARPVQPIGKYLTKQQSDNLREAYEERRAILEFDAGYSRSEADRRAWLMVYGKGKNQQ